MRSRHTLFVLVFACIATTAPAQLQNGSFESCAAFWVDPCGYMDCTTGGHAGGGLLCAEAALYNLQPPCAPDDAAGTFYQKLPAIQDGDHVDLSFWYRVVADDPVNQPFVEMHGHFGWVDGSGMMQGSADGIFAGPAAPDTSWQSATWSFTYQLSAGDTAVIGLGGHGLQPAYTGVIYFDEVAVVVNNSTGTAPAPLPEASLRYDASAQQVWITMPGTEIRSVAVHDAAGRHLVSPTTGGYSAPVFSVAELPVGLYIVHVITSAGALSLRVMK